MSSSSSLNPTTRSRTLLFISYRDSRAGSSRFRRSRVVTTYDPAQVDDDEHERLIDAEAAHIAIDAQLPPKWVDIADQVKEIIAGIQTKITVLDRLHAKHVLPGFSDRTAEEREIEMSTTDVTKDFRQCHDLIQRIGSIPNHTFPPTQPGGSHQPELAAKNVQRGLAAKVQELSAIFRKKQRVYMEKLQGHAIKNQDMLAASGAVSLKGSAGMSALDEDLEAAEASHQSVIQRQMALELDLQTRDRELTEIAKSIAQLAELFKSLSDLVIDQGTLLDSVEYNIEQTAAHMEDAVRELDTAQRYQKNTGRRACIFLLLLIIFGLIIALIFKPRRPHSAAAPPPPLPSASSPEEQKQPQKKENLRGSGSVINRAAEVGVVVPVVPVLRVGKGWVDHAVVVEEEAPEGAESFRSVDDDDDQEEDAGLGEEELSQSGEVWYSAATAASATATSTPLSTFSAVPVPWPSGRRVLRRSRRLGRVMGMID